MIVYVVTMYRFGNREKHSYPLGVFSNYDFARRFGQDEEYTRGGKYKPDITTWEIDHPVIEFESEKARKNE